MSFLGHSQSIFGIPQVCRRDKSHFLCPLSLCLSLSPSLCRLLLQIVFLILLFFIYIFFYCIFFFVVMQLVHLIYARN